MVRLTLAGFLGLIAAAQAAAESPNILLPATSAYELPLDVAAADRLAPLDYHDLSTRADELLGKRTYADALPILEKLVRAFPAQGDRWSDLARCQRAEGQFAAAAESYRRAMALGFGRAEAHALEIACLELQSGRPDEAYRWLNRSLDLRAGSRLLFRRAAQLAPLRDEPAFREIAGYEPSGLSRDERWRHDLRFLTREMRRLHPLLEQRVRVERIEAEADELAKRVASLSDAEMMVEIQGLLTLLGDGHSHIVWDHRDIELKRLPLRFYWFTDGLFVIAADEPHVELVGSRVLRIGDTPIEEALARLDRTVSRDNPIWIKTIGPGQLTLLPVLEVLGLADNLDRATLTFSSRRGQEQSVTLEGAPYPARPGGWPEIPGVERPLWLRNVDRSFGHEWLPKSGAVYVGFNAVGDDPGQSLAAYGERLLKEVQAHPQVRHVLVDVRHNGGGNSFLYVPLLRTLIALEAAPPARKLWVLTGRNTFSACQNFVTDVDRLTNAVFVGEPTGSRPQSIGESNTIVLPCTRVQLSIASLNWQLGWPTDRRVWIAPDIPAELSSVDYFAGRDPGVETILALIERAASQDPEPGA